MSTLYGAEHRALQDEFDSRRLADMLESSHVRHQVDDDAQAFIESRSFFFLSTVGPDGQPTVSHKGGAAGFVRVLDPSTLVFPSYDGNGMFLSMGNIAGDGRIGLLFMDFDRPHRVRVHAHAVIVRDDPLMAAYPGADLVVRATVVDAFVNCPRYIGHQSAAGAPKYVPDVNGEAPLAEWKKIDALQPFLPERFQAAAREQAITAEEYGARLLNGDG
ncbi:MAG: putative pyridoxamine 5-phosphate oxidase, putative flavin-nucleotide-binding protein [Ilumatobacteraceae bacterium]|nr:putative pyridoxamine 5-phosphate oxidase, putative flavin-nucleotide-binding protein [Ilumatobacteraceae bacterium]